MRLSPHAFFSIALSLLPALLRAGPEAVVTFNELQYHPAPTQTSGEWIELRNLHSVDVDLSGWQLDGGVDFVFPPGSKIAGGKYLIIAANPAAFQAATGFAAHGPFSSLLADGGEKVTLKNKNGRVMDAVAYNDRFPWPVAADGSGATLAKVNENGASDDPRNWRASLAFGGTPGDYNFTPAAGVAVPAASQAAVRRYVCAVASASHGCGGPFSALHDRAFREGGDGDDRRDRGPVVPRLCRRGKWRGDAALRGWRGAGDGANGDDARRGNGPLVHRIERAFDHVFRRADRRHRDLAHGLRCGLGAGARERREPTGRSRADECDAAKTGHQRERAFPQSHLHSGRPGGKRFSPAAPDRRERYRCFQRHVLAGARGRAE